MADGALKGFTMTDKQSLFPSLSGWYSATDPGSKVCVMDGSRPRLLERKPLLIGEWPPKLGEGLHGPLSARPAWVLCAILGITYETFLCLFSRINLMNYWKGWNPPRVSTLRFMATGLELAGEPIILLGRRVCQAYGFSRFNYQWGTLDQVPTVAIPHPTSRKLKQASERQQVRETLELALLYHGKIFRVGDWPNGTGSMIQIQRGVCWGDAARRLRHRANTGAKK